MDKPSFMDVSGGAIHSLVNPELGCSTMRELLATAYAQRVVSGFSARHESEFMLAYLGMELHLGELVTDCAEAHNTIRICKALQAGSTAILQGLVDSWQPETEREEI